MRQRRTLPAHTGGRPPLVSVRWAAVQRPVRPGSGPASVGQTLKSGACGRGWQRSCDVPSSYDGASTTCRLLSEVICLGRIRAQGITITWARTRLRGHHPLSQHSAPGVRRRVTPGCSGRRRRSRRGRTSASPGADEDSRPAARTADPGRCSCGTRRRCRTASARASVPPVLADAEPGSLVLLGPRGLGCQQESCGTVDECRLARPGVRDGSAPREQGDVRTVGIRAADSLVDRVRERLHPALRQRPAESREVARPRPWPPPLARSQYPPGADCPHRSPSMQKIVLCRVSGLGVRCGLCR